MDLGLHYWNYSRPAEPELIASTLAETARLADAGGLSSFTPMDHYFQMPHRGGGPDDPMLEGYTTLGFVAAHTQRIALGLLVTGVTYRHPGLLAKIVATLDVLSGGRAFFGIGAGWYEREQRGLGVPVAPLAERFERLEETVQICLQMWSDDNGSYSGRHYQLEETLCVPAPLSGRRPMVMIGGGGEKKTLRLVARYADACNLFATSIDDVTHKLEVLRSHCDTEGRDFDAIRKTVMYSRGPLRDPDTFLAEAEVYTRLGVEEIQLLPDRHPVEFTEQVVDRLLPRIASLP
ncbi:LLM class F420-dependent oxidoreductase [Phycicoccus sp. SLBN-51]|uniref:LLM class F420-dependent oxidoreductase n=1 Tax=Phycicoccus sp. SLBN-51 TaxID=2768447 RepID=UPI0011520699|nr:LLM class F420-dependent oxidoreductase [Phycicoccus sp. SLBN-51]TQJ52252.1 F420-dependent oxidoreductase-like protein [Phycicoccus sp. SLBN-51]